MNHPNWIRTLATLLVCGALALGAQEAAPTKGSAPAAPAKVKSGGKHSGKAVAKSAGDPVAPADKAVAAPVAGDPENEGARTLTAKRMEWVKEEPYDPYEPPVVNAGLNVATMIQLPPAEVLIDSQAGNTKTWKMTPIYGRNTIYLKPTQGAASTNLHMICKSGNVYTFFITMDPSKPVVQVYRALPSSGDSGGVRTPGEVEPDEGSNGNGGVALAAGSRRGVEPEEVQKLLRQARDQERAKADSEKREFAEKMLAGRNDDYQVEHERWSPFQITNIFDVDGVTYIRFNSKDRSLPNFEVLGEDGKPGPTKWGVSPEDPHVIVVDQIFSRAVMTIGKSRAKIANKGMAKANLKPANEQK